MIMEPPIMCCLLLLTAVFILFLMNTSEKENKLFFTPGYGRIIPDGYTVLRVHFIHKKKEVNIDKNKSDQQVAYLKTNVVSKSKIWDNRTEDRSNLNKTEPSILYLDQILDTDLIYWSDYIEKNLPVGFTEKDSDEWTEYVTEKEVIHLDIGCGRQQNRKIMLSDGTMACARYRQNIDLLQGELYSYFLGKLLNLTNLAPLTISFVNTNLKRWSGIPKSEIEDAAWLNGHPIIIMKWVQFLTPATIPTMFKTFERHLKKFDTNITLNTESIMAPAINWEKLITRDTTPGPGHGKFVVKESIENLVELASWSDLIIFDYLIANLDRVVNNMYNFQWNSNIMEYYAHNLAKNYKTRLLLFLDNESGLLHGYRLLKKYKAYHSLLLDNLCLFRKPTVHYLRQLQNQDISKLFNDSYAKSIGNQQQEMRYSLPPLPEKSIKILSDRIQNVLIQVEKCKVRFDGKNVLNDVDRT